MERRKFLIGAGSLAAGSAAAMGTGAFTSVSAGRSMEVSTADDADALLALKAHNTPNGNEYVNENGNVISIDISNADEGGQGANKDAYTVIRNLFQVSNNGTQNVYVWATGLPKEVRMFHDDSDGPINDIDNSGYSINNGANKGAFSTSSSIDPQDIPGQVEDGSGDDEAAPLLGSGDTLNNVGLLVDTRGDKTLDDFDQDITIKAVDADKFSQ